MRIIKRLTLGTVLGAGLAISPLTAGAASFINILTGGTSGVYYPLGVGLSEIFQENIADVRSQVQATKASVENLTLLSRGRGELAFVLGDSLMAAWEGNAEAGFPQKLDNLRIVAAIYPNYVQFVSAPEAGIATLEDLKGKTLSVGAPASGAELNARAIFKAAGMSYDDLGRVEYLPYAESAELIKNRQLDATLQSAGLGVAFIQDLAATHGIRIVAIDPAIAEKLGAPFRAAIIPANTYNGQGADVPTIAIPNYLVSSADVPDDLVYEMTKAAFGHLDRLRAAHGAAEGITLEDAAKDAPIPLHPGAERYYREQGVLN